MLEELNAALEGAGVIVSVEDSVLDIELYDAHIEFNFEDESLSTLISSQEKMERDLAQLDRFQAVLEEKQLSASLINYFNADHELDKLIGAVVPELTQENLEAVTTMCLEGVSNTAKRVWDAIVRFFQNLIIRVKAWFKRVIPFRKGLEAKLKATVEEAAKADTAGNKDWADKEINALKKADFDDKLTAVSDAIAALKGVGDKLSDAEINALNKFAGKVLGKTISGKHAGEGARATVKYSFVADKNAKPAAPASGKISELGYNEAAIKSALKGTAGVVGNLKDLEGLEGKLIKGSNDAIATAKKGIARGEADTADYRAARADAARLGVYTTLITAVYREGIALGNQALRLGRALPKAKKD